MNPIPNGYMEVENYATYRIKWETTIITGCCGTRIVKQEWIGLTRKQFADRTACDPVIFAVKGIQKPLFPDAPPFPHGY